MRKTTRIQDHKMHYSRNESNENSGPVRYTVDSVDVRPVSNVVDVHRFIKYTITKTTKQYTNKFELFVTVYKRRVNNRRVALVTKISEKRGLCTVLLRPREPEYKALAQLIQKRIKDDAGNVYMRDIPLTLDVTCTGMKKTYAGMDVHFEYMYEGEARSITAILEQSGSEYTLDRVKASIHNSPLTYYCYRDPRAHYPSVYTAVYYMVGRLLQEHSEDMFSYAES